MFSVNAGSSCVTEVIEPKYQLKISLLDNHVLTSTGTKPEMETKNIVEREKAIQ
jgi:hypothetical protein